MKLTLDLSVHHLKSPSCFNDFTINGLPDTESGRYSVDDCIIIKDKNVKAIISNNTDVIDLKIFKSKNIFKQTPTVYKIYFKKSGSGALTIFHKNNSKRSFGIFLPEKKEVMKFGNIFERGEKYEKFWEKRNSDVLYTKDDTDVLTDVKESLKKGSIPSIKITSQKNNLEKTIKECLPYLNTYMIIIIPLEHFKNSYIELSEKYKMVKFCLLFEMNNMGYSVDETNTLGHIKGLELLQLEADKRIEKIQSLGIKSPWLIGFNQNKSDSYNNNAISIKFNNDIWLNYIFYISRILKKTNLEGLLYNIPVGLLNKNDTSRHTNTACDYEDGSVFFFFGGKFTTKSLFYKENYWNDKKLIVLGDLVTYENHINLCTKNNIKYLLFGSELNTGTTASFSHYSVGKATDKENLVKSIRNYKKNIF